jgi:hypothetical protein
MHNKYQQINNKDPLQNLWFITVILEHTLLPQHTTSNHTKETNKMSVSDDTSSAAYIAATIKNNSKDNGGEHMSDVVHNDDDVSKNYASDDED